MKSIDPDTGAVELDHGLDGLEAPWRCCRDPESPIPLNWGMFLKLDIYIYIHMRERERERERERSLV